MLSTTIRRTVSCQRHLPRSYHVTFPTLAVQGVKRFARLLAVKRSGSHYHPLSTSSSSTSPRSTSHPSTTTTTHHVQQDDELVYQSPLGNVVTKLRTVSLATGIIGSLGLPLSVAIKGSNLPSTGLLAFGMAFVAASLGSTCAIHYVFRPYVYTIERIPVRVCSYKKQNEQSSDGLADVLNNTSNNTTKLIAKDVLFKAVSKTLFLTKREIVFDPRTDVQPYQGLRPLCNFTAKGIPLYVHSEYISNPDLVQALNLKKAPTDKPTTKDDSDDLF